MSVTPRCHPAREKEVVSKVSIRIGTELCALRVSRWMSTRRPLAKLQAVTAAADGISEKMSKSEIQSWAQRVEGDDDQSTGFDWESLDEKWDDFLKYAQLQVTSGKTKTRTVFLQERLLPLAARAGARHKADAQPAAADKPHTRTGSTQDHRCLQVAYPHIPPIHRQRVSHCSYRSPENHGPER